MRCSTPVHRFVLVALVGVAAQVARADHPCDILSDDPITTPWTKCAKRVNPCFGDYENPNLCLPITVYKFYRGLTEVGYWTGPQGWATCTHYREAANCRHEGPIDARAKVAEFYDWPTCGAGGPNDSCTIYGEVCVYVDLWLPQETACPEDGQYYSGAEIWSCMCELDEQAGGLGLLADAEPSW